MDALTRAIYECADLREIKDLVGKVGRSAIESEDDHCLTTLHHAILANHVDVVEYLLLSGYFDSRHRPALGPPYLHISGLLGFKRVTNVLFQYRPADCQEQIHRRDSWLRWEDLSTVLEAQGAPPHVLASLQKTQRSLQNITDESILPLDTAALAGHVNVVKLLLNAFQRSNGVSYIEGAVMLNCSRAISLLLASEDFDLRHLEDAVRTALRRKQPKCLELLLQHGVNISSVFNGLNPYHVMYMYCSAYTANGATSVSFGIDSCTEVLVSFTEDVNAKLPVGSYPLYSLLHALVCEKDRAPTNVPESHLVSLKYLLEAGADPNFDEVWYSKQYEKEEHRLTVGRELFTSGLNALFVSLQSSDTWRAFMTEHLGTCCYLLLSHGADVYHTDSYGETPIHDLMKLWAMQHAVGHMHVDLSNMVVLLLQHGLDPGKTSSNGLFAIHYYFKILFNLMGGLIAYERWRTFNDSMNIFHILNFMSHADASIAYNEILKSCAEAKHHEQEGVPDNLTDFLKEKAEPLIFQTKSLQMYCMLVIWQAVARNKAHLDVLPLPKSHISDLKHMFDIIT